MPRRKQLAFVSNILVTILGALLVPCALSQSVLYNFQNAPDGSDPRGKLIADSAGNLYGTTYLGGQWKRGAIFEVMAGGGEQILYSFLGGADGMFPVGNLVRDPAGNLFGTASAGGSLAGNCTFVNGCGVVYKLSPDGSLTTLYTFTGGADGATPSAGLIHDSQGNFYGVTALGGTTAGPCGLSTVPQQGCGVVFKLAPGGIETVLHTFAGVPDGQAPEATLARDLAGNLYGTTSRGGTTAQGFPCVQSTIEGCGTVFRIDSAGHETVLYAFTSAADGGFPANGTLALDSSGNVYGTATAGGASGDGVVFRVDPLGNETVLYSFPGGSLGSVPFGGVIRSNNGNLFGTTTMGGIVGGSCGANGCGLVFKLSPTGTETVLFRLRGLAASSSDLLMRQGVLYGVAEEGGGHAAGGIFTAKP